MRRRWLASVGVTLGGQDGDFFPAGFRHRPNLIGSERTDGHDRTGLWNILGQLCGYQHLLGPRFGMRCDQGGRRADCEFSKQERGQNKLCEGGCQ
jgi:hypothetical protein